MAETSLTIKASRKGKTKKEQKMAKLIHYVVKPLVIVGGINQGLSAAFGLDVIGRVLSGGFARILYMLIGISAVMLAVLMFRGKSGGKKK
jgi:uncharacterized membrane protein YuzA (DUF378 family)